MKDVDSSDDKSIQRKIWQAELRVQYLNNAIEAAEKSCAKPGFDQ